VLSEDPPLVFPGNIPGRHIRETGARGCFLVDVDDAGKTALTFHALDVFRWELCEVDAAPCRSGEEVLERFAAALQEAEQKSGDRPLAVRVLVQGRTPAHSDLLAEPDRWIQEFRAVALDLAGSVWIEQVRFLTSARDDSSDSASTEGALGEILACVNEIRDDEALLRELAEELAVVRSKLPEELRDGLDDPAHIRGLLDDVTPFLGARLRAQDVKR
jgi:exonuclease SbcD